MADGSNRAQARFFRFGGLISQAILWTAGLASLLCLGLLMAAAAGSGPIDVRTAATLTALFFAVFSFFFRSVEAERQSRKQHTIKILFDTRLSSEFRQHLEHRRVHFKEGAEIDATRYHAFLIAARDSEITEEEALARRKSAEAVRSLLNYYEFIALGIATGDLDEDMLRGSLRGIMCRLVKDAHQVVRSYWTPDDRRTYEHLAALYERWRDRDYPSLA
ncbi:MAG: DUF4760 domain-containing protein [Pseudomonadota bacterium]